MELEKRPWDGSLSGAPFGRCTRSRQQRISGSSNWSASPTISSTCSIAGQKKMPVRWRSSTDVGCQGPADRPARPRGDCAEDAAARTRPGRIAKAIAGRPGRYLASLNGAAASRGVGAGRFPVTLVQLSRRSAGSAGDLEGVDALESARRRELVERAFRTCTIKGNAGCSAS